LGASLDLADKRGFRPIHYACQHGHSQIVSLLLKQGIVCTEPNLLTQDTPLHLVVQSSAVENETETIVQELLSRGGLATLRTVNRNGTPLELACELGKVRLVGIMLRRLSDIGQLERLNQDSPNCLHLSSKNGHNDCIRLLLQYGLNTDLNRLSDRCQGAPLHEACRYGRLQTVKFLLECGADPLRTNQLGQIPRDVVIRQQSVAPDIKCLLGEFSQQVVAQALCPYQGGAGALSFKAGDHLIVLDRPAIPESADEIYSSLGVSGGVGLWRGFILDRTSFTSRSGYFPASHVKLLKDTSTAPCVISLLRQGLSDSQVTFAWLNDCNLSQYYHLFVQAGYDLLTLFRATPADLCAIGVHDPAHRTQLKQSMSSLDVSGLDLQLGRLLETVVSVEHLLSLIHLKQYISALSTYTLDEFSSSLSWEDLEELGIKKLGHQKKLLLIAKRLREIRTNKRNDQIKTDTNTNILSKIHITSSPCKPVMPQRVINSPNGKKPLPPPRKSSTVTQNSKDLGPRSSSSSSPASSHTGSGTISPSSTSSSSDTNPYDFLKQQVNTLPNPTLE